MPIYVVETSRGPRQLRGANTVAAYATRDSAERCARSIGGAVVEYAPAGSGPDSESLARELAERLEVIAQLQERCAYLARELQSVYAAIGTHTGSNLRDERARQAGKALRLLAEMRELAREIR
jgi:hypothetical protein